MTTSPALLDLHLQMRPISTDDAPSLADLFNACLASRLFTYDTEDTTPARQRDSISSADARFPWLVADTNGTLAGYARLSAYGGTRPWHHGLAEVSIGVLPTYRGRGLAARLLQQAGMAARDAGFWKIVALVFHENTASLRLFRRAGFREVGVFERHGNLDGRWVNVVIFEHVIADNQR